MLTHSEVMRVGYLMTITDGVPISFYEKVMKAEYGDRVERVDIAALLAHLVDKEGFELEHRAKKAKYSLSDGRAHLRRLLYLQDMEVREHNAKEAAEKREEEERASAAQSQKLSKSQRRRANRKKRLEEEEVGDALANECVQNKLSKSQRRRANRKKRLEKEKAAQTSLTK